MSSQPHGAATPRPRSIAPEDCPVLVVDDDESLVESLRRTLRKAGYPVTKRPSPAAALHGPPVTGLTVLVTDLDMPGMDGIELSRQMLAHDPDLAVIVLTGFCHRGVRGRRARIGVDRVLTEAAWRRPLGGGGWTRAA